MIHSDDEDHWKTAKHTFMYDQHTLEYNYNYNISPSKKNPKHSKRKKSLTTSPRNGRIPSNSPEIFEFEEEHSRSPKENTPLQKSKSKRRVVREVRLRSKLVIDDLLTAIPDWAVCAVCNEVFKQPTSTPECGHTFCYQCLELVLGSKNRQCPICRKTFHPELNIKELSPNHQLIHVIDSLPVRCRWGVRPSENGEWIPDQEGCPKITEWQNLFIHDEECQYILVQCTSKDCTEVVQKRALPEHLANCQFRNILCDLCSASYQFKDTPQHENNCPLRKILCPKGCGQFILNQDKNLHVQRQCPEVEVSCIYSDLGCTYTGQKRNLDEHVRSCIFHSLRPFIMKTQDTIGNLIKCQQDQQQIIEKQQKEIQHLHRLINLQEGQIFQLQAKAKHLQASNDTDLNKVAPSPPIPITDTSKQSLAGGLWNRLYRIIDPEFVPRDVASGHVHAHGQRGSIHSL